MLTEVVATAVVRLQAITAGIAIAVVHLQVAVVVTVHRQTAAGNLMEPLTVTGPIEAANQV